MPKQPADIFEEELDISGFTRKPDAPAPTPAAAVIAAAEAQNFHSREPKPSKLKKNDRRYRTGRNIPLATKISAKANQMLYSIHAEHQGKENWTLGQIIEFALEAFTRDLDSHKARD